jgi:membrane protein involved in D-alanine export
MIPYASFEYFLFLLYPLAIAIVLGVIGRLGPRAVLLISVVVVLVQIRNPLGDASELAAGLRQLTFLLLYVGLSVVVVLGFAALRRKAKRRGTFYGAVGLVLLPLVLVKLMPLLAPRLGPTVASSAILGQLLGVASDAGTSAGPAGSAGLVDTFGFLGISYLTFRVIDALIVQQDSLAKYPASVGGLLSFFLFFPTISSGPIDRYNRYLGDLAQLPRPSGAYLLDVEAGISRIAQGFLYKFIVAYLLFANVLQPATKIPGLGGTLIYMYGYSFYLFFDFAGYSAFAIGVGRFFGVRVPENFDAPFMSRNIQEVWNRWHMSLSFWFRDHIYRRFLLMAIGRKWFGGNRHAANAAGLLLTMGIMGAWHGLQPHYLVYGLYQGALLVGFDVYSRWNRRHEAVPDTWFTHAAAIFLTFNLFCFGLLIFSGHLFT